MKILFFIESLRSGGKERRLVELIKALKQYPNIECELVLTRKDVHYEDIFKLEIAVHFIERKYLKKDPRLFFLFYKICKKFKPDIIHVWGNMAALYAIPTKILLKIPMINNQITDAPLKVNHGLLSHKLTFPFSDLIVSNSKAGLKSYNAPQYKTKVIYNGFDFNRIQNLPSKETLKQKFRINTKKVIGMVASFSDNKDCETYISAAQVILQRRHDITFLAIGNGKNLQRCKKMVLPEFKDRIKFLGRQKYIESLINIFDIGILTTNQEIHGEGISNSIMEYMALGKPAIATDGGGTNELVVDGEVGFLVKQKSVEDLASKIAYLLNNEEVAINMGAKGRERIKQEFNLENMTRSFVNLYRSLLMNKGI